jgi:hypothetical protein
MMGGGDGEEFQTIIMHDNLEDELELNLDKAIDNIQVKLVESIEPIMPHVGVKEPTIASVVEHAHVENPQFFITQLVLISSYSIDNVKQINMFLEQAIQNATT